MNISGVNMSGAMADAPVVPAAPRKNFSSQGQAAQNADAGREKIEQIVDKMQSRIDSMNVSLSFSTYGDSGENVAIVVSNKDTGKVIREIPAKEIQKLYAKMSELAGTILNGDA